MKDKLDTLVISLMSLCLLSAFFIAGYDYRRRDECLKIEGAVYSYDLGMCLKIKEGNNALKNKGDIYVTKRN